MTPDCESACSYVSGDYSQFIPHKLTESDCNPNTCLSVFFLFFSGGGSCFIIAMSSQTSYGSSVLCELLRSFRLSVFVLTNWCWLSVAFLFSFCFLTFSPVHKRRLECISGYSRRIVERVQLTVARGFHKQQQHISCVSGTHVYSVFTFLFWPLISNVL